jgi:hypothetical protein
MRSEAANEMLEDGTDEGSAIARYVSWLSILDAAGCLDTQKPQL